VTFELMKGIEADSASHLQPGEFDRLRDVLLRLATTIDPIGAFGMSDERATAARPRSGR